jgi:hypothetical protein
MINTLVEKWVMEISQQPPKEEIQKADKKVKNVDISRN